jgi:hypothetical protein
MENLKSRINSDVTLARLDYLTQVGFTKIQLANFTGVQAQTIRRMFRRRPEKISMDTHLKVKAFHSDYIISKSNLENSIPEDDEPVIDFADSEQGAKEVAKWMWLSLGITAMALIALIFVIRYVLSLF